MRNGLSRSQECLNLMELFNFRLLMSRVEIRYEVIDQLVDYFSIRLRDWYSSSYAGNVSNLGVKSLVSASQEERSESYSIAAAFDHKTSHTVNVKSNRAASTCFLLKSFSCPTLPSLWHKDSMAFIRLTIRKVKEVRTSWFCDITFQYNYCTNFFCTHISISASEYWLNHLKSLGFC